MDGQLAVWSTPTGHRDTGTTGQLPVEDFGTTMDGQLAVWSTPTGHRDTGTTGQLPVEDRPADTGWRVSRSGAGITRAGSTDTPGG